METRTTTRYTVLMVFYMSISATTLLAQCENPKTQIQKSESHLNNDQPSLKSMNTLSPQTTPPLVCVYAPETPQHNHNGPNPSPPKQERPKFAVWCVSKPTMAGPVVQRALDYACGMGADCGPIQPNGPCFQPNTVQAHASYAFNSYFQRTKLAGGTCDFGGTAMLVTDDPSFNGCSFLFT